jgi:hypothetical protein
MRGEERSLPLFTGACLDHLKIDRRPAADRSVRQTRPSAFFGRERSDLCGQFLTRVRIGGPVLDGCTRRIFTQEIIAFPVPCRPDRSEENPPPQFGQTFPNRLSAQALQKVHSKLQIIASSASGGSFLLQCSQVGLSSSIICLLSCPMLIGSPGARAFRLHSHPGPAPTSLSQAPLRVPGKTGSETRRPIERGNGETHAVPSPPAPPVVRRKFLRALHGR